MQALAIGVVVGSGVVVASTANGVSAKASYRSPNEIGNCVERFCTAWRSSHVALAFASDANTTEVPQVAPAIESMARANPDIVLSVWQTSGEFVGAEVAIEFPELASNTAIHALATWVSRVSQYQTVVLVLLNGPEVRLLPVDHGIAQLEELATFMHGEPPSKIAAAIHRQASPLVSPTIVFAVEKPHHDTREQISSAISKQHSVIDVGSIVRVDGITSLAARAVAVLQMEARI